MTTLIRRGVIGLAVPAALGVMGVSFAGPADRAGTPPAAAAASATASTGDARSRARASVRAAPSAATQGLAADTPEAPPTPWRAAKAETLIRRRLPCLGCHRLGGEGGRIGPDLTDVGSRRSAAYIRRMTRDPQATVPGTAMPKVPMPNETFELVVAYLTATGADSEARAPDGTAVTSDGRDGAGLQANGSAVARVRVARSTSSAPPVTDGATLYGRYCAACHGVEGRGDGPNAQHLPVTPTAHADPAYMSKRPDDSLFDAIFAGGRIMGMSHRMPAWGETLSHGQIRALVGYLRELCGCEGPEWSRDGGGAS